MGLRPLQEALNRKADEVQRAFIELSDRVDELSKRILEARGDERRALRDEQNSLREDQNRVAEEINLWRDRARKVLQQPGRESLRAYLHELGELDDPIVQPAVEQALRVMDMPPEELVDLAQDQRPIEKTPAARLIERARTEFDLRSGDPALRKREAVTFANRPGMAQDEDALAEMETAMDDPDPLVRELATLTTIQIHRFRALRFADLERAHQSVKILARLKHLAVIPVLVEILATPRSGFLESQEGALESNNNRSRMVALLRLVEWHTSEAQVAIQAVRFDRDPHLVRAAERALELFPDAWSGPLQK
jgi:hypothetical protein